MKEKKMTEKWMKIQRKRNKNNEGKKKETIIKKNGEIMMKEKWMKRKWLKDERK